MDLFDLVAKIRLDDSEYKDGVGKAKGTFSTLTSGVKTGLTTVAKVGAAAVTAGVAGVTALTKMGVEAYAQYEQLTGGVETLFGTSSNTVMQYAENAYKTSGLSANAYMETVTSFSASLIQSLDGDTAKAAKVADMAITDMSDNANKMGTDIGMIQNAYNGFAKGNFTMLDNLKLGYGGTKEEMQRLLDKAGEISGIEYDISSFSDISEAIHVIQQDMEISGISYEEAMAKVASGEMTMKEAMDAMGTTAREAATTIEGSLNMMKGAWQNLVVGMADSNANMEALINNFVESTAIAAQNLLPRIEQTLVGIGQLITALAPVIAAALPTLVESVLPALLAAGVSLVASIVNGVVTALPALYSALLGAVQVILVEVFGVSEARAGEFADGINAFFTSIKDGFAAFVASAQTEGTFLNQIWTNLQAAFEVIKGALSAAFDAVAAAFRYCAEQINTEGTWLNTTWVGIQNAVLAMFNLVSATFNALSAAFAWCVDKINTEGTVLNAIWDYALSYASATWGIIQALISGAISVIQSVIQVFTAVLQGDWSAAWEAVKATAQAVWDAISSFISSVLSGISDIVSSSMGVVQSVISAAWYGIQSATSAVFNAVLSTVSSVWNGITSAVSTAINAVDSAISSGLSTASATASSILDNIISKFTSIFDSVKEVVTSAIETVKGAFNFSWSLPKLSLPHISVYGGEPPYGIGGAGSLPSFSISWYKKAMNNAMVLSNPTIFGYSSESGKFLGGGDGNGNEVIAGESYLMRMISNAVAAQMDGVTRGVTVNQYIQSVPQTPVEMAAATEAYFEQARWML